VSHTKGVSMLALALESVQRLTEELAASHVEIKQLREDVDILHFGWMHGFPPGPWCKERQDAFMQEVDGVLNRMYERGLDELDLQETKEKS